MCIVRHTLSRALLDYGMKVPARFQTVLLLDYGTIVPARFFTALFDYGSKVPARLSRVLLDYSMKVTAQFQTQLLDYGMNVPARCSPALIDYDTKVSRDLRDDCTNVFDYGAKGPARFSRASWITAGKFQYGFRCRFSITAQMFQHFLDGAPRLRTKFPARFSAALIHCRTKVSDRF